MQYLGISNEIKMSKCSQLLENYWDSRRDPVAIEELLGMEAKYSPHFLQAKEMAGKSPSPVMLAFRDIEEFIKQRKEKMDVKVEMNGWSQTFKACEVQWIPFFPERVKEFWDAHQTPNKESSETEGHKLN